MRTQLSFALFAVLAVTAFPAATRSIGTDPIMREQVLPSIKIRHADGSIHDGLRCGVKSPSHLERDILERQLMEFRKQLGDAGVLKNVSSAPAITIPVWFHIITKNSRKTGKVSNSQIKKQLTVLNNAYAGRGFSFTHAGTTRTNKKSWFDGCGTESVEKSMKNKLAVDPAHNLNFYSCKPGDYLGFAWFPTSFRETDKQHGVVVLHSTFPGGASTNYNLGDTGTHEVGHYLGLYHTFEGGCKAPGDSVADTPAEASAASGCPVGRNTCPGGGPDPIKNFMDYSDDSCMNTFSDDQSIRMQDLVKMHKPSLGR